MRNYQVFDGYMPINFNNLMNFVTFCDLLVIQNVTLKIMTKHYFIFSVCIFLSAFSNAQFFNSSVNPYWIIYDDEANGPSPKIHHFNFKEMIVKAGKKSMRYIYNYDAEGRMIAYLEEKTKDKLKNDDNKKNRGFLVSYAKSADRLKQKIQYIKNSEVIVTDSFNYNKFDRTTLYARFDKGHKLKNQDVYSYDSTLLKEHHAYTFKKDKMKEVSKEIYEYESDLQLKKITYYNQKNKAYKKTVFDCNPMGVNHKISKDSSYKCVKYDNDSLGNKIQITIENVKNKSTKVILYYDKQNKVIARKNFDLKKNQPLHYSFYHPETGVTIKYISFHKGKEDYKFEIKFDDKNNKTEQTTYVKNKMTSIFKYEYNPQGLLVAGKGYNRRNELKRVVAYNYGLKE